MSRATRRFRSEGAPWDALASWADEYGFKQVHKDAVRTKYRKGRGLGTAPIYVEMIYTEPWTHLQGWVGINLLVRPGVLFFARSEWEPREGGWRLKRSRRIARELINRLFESFEVDPIE
jgi:hypothetical protein